MYKKIEFTPEELRAAVEEAGNFGLRVAAHAHADVIAVKGDPIADIRVLEHVAFVMKEGTVYKREVKPGREPQ